MTMTFKEALIAHLQGEKVQCMGCESTWKPLMKKIGEGLIRYVDTQSYMSGCSFRIAPRTILVNGVEVPAPQVESPEKYDCYYVPDTAEKIFTMTSHGAAMKWITGILSAVYFTVTKNRPSRALKPC